jgi:hypothetical protein
MFVERVTRCRVRGKDGSSKRSDFEKIPHAGLAPVAVLNDGATLSDGERVCL